MYLFTRNVASAVASSIRRSVVGIENGWRSLALAGIAAAVATLVSSTSATAVDLQFNFGPALHTYSGHQSPGFQQGDFLATDNTWNQITAPVPVNSTNPLQADGTVATGVAVQTGDRFDQGFPVWGLTGMSNNYTAGAPTPGTVYDTALMQNLSYDTSSAYVGLRVSGLTPGKYDVYVTAYNGDQPGNHNDVYIGLNLSNNYMISNQFLGQTSAVVLGVPAATGSETTWISGTNYVMETITVTSTSDWLTVIDSNALDGGGTPAAFNAVQIAEVVPEPGSVALLVLGGLGLVALLAMERKMKPVRIVLALLPVALSASAALATSIPLTTATATVEQGVLPVAQSIDGIITSGLNGWGIDPGESFNQTAVYQTVSNVVAGGGGTSFTFSLFNDYAGGPPYILGDFRISVTADAAPTTTSGATWTELTPLTANATNTFLLTINPTDHSILASGGSGNNTSDFTVTATTTLNNITGFRLEALTNPSLPLYHVELPGNGGGPGMASNGNFVLTEFQVNATELVPEPSALVLLGLGCMAMLACRLR